MQTSMSVPLKQVDAIKFVQIQMAALYVAVMQASRCWQTTKLALVCFKVIAIEKT